MISFLQAVETCLSEKYFTLSGRASRAEYWWFALATFLILVVLSSALGGVAVLYKSEGGMLYMMLLLLLVLGILALAIPSVTVCVRRLHDTGRSGWWYLVNFVPYIGSLVLLVLLLLPSDPDENEYGAPYSAPEA
ncbi:MAG: DUF805 domain-containing protein [Paludibacteraceae bacterium]|nr:DUF805 domain-containing protein [Paludibacteraceae bacterium]